MKTMGLNTENPDDIPKISTFLRSICTITAPGERQGHVERGTGFLAFVPAIGGICFFSAGHVFKRVIKARPEETLDELNKCIVTFGNFDGHLHWQASSRLGMLEPMSLKVFFESLGSYYGSIYDSGTLKVFKKGDGPQAPRYSFTDEDYCAILLNGSCLDDVKRDIGALGLSYLECGQGDYLDYKRGGIVQVVGHPSVDDSNKDPLRISIGHERSGVGDKLYVDYDSLGGNSGSPVIGRGHKSNIPGMDQAYKVKAIHIRGTASQGNTLETNTNCSQGIRNVQSWISYAQ